MSMANISNDIKSIVCIKDKFNMIVDQVHEEGGKEKEQHHQQLKQAKLISSTMINPVLAGNSKDQEARDHGRHTVQMAGVEAAGDDVSKESDRNDKGVKRRSISKEQGRAT